MGACCGARDEKIGLDSAETYHSGLTAKQKKQEWKQNQVEKVSEGSDDFRQDIHGGAVIRTNTYLDITLAK